MPISTLAPSHTLIWAKVISKSIFFPWSRQPFLKGLKQLHCVSDLQSCHIPNYPPHQSWGDLSKRLFRDTEPIVSASLFTEDADPSSLGLFSCLAT